MGRREERLGRGGAPVDEQLPPGDVGEPEPAHVHRLGVGLAHHAPQAQVETEAAKGAKPGAEPVHLEVAVHRLLPLAGRCSQLGVEPRREHGDRLLESRADGGEVPLVGRDERRIRLVGQAFGEVEGAACHGFTSARSVPDGSP